MSQENKKTLETDSSAEVKRLVKNWRAMLDIIPEMVLLVRDDLVIQYMNLQALSIFGDLRGQKCVDTLCGADAGCNTDCPVQKAFLGTTPRGGMVEMQVKGMDIEFTSVPFLGYSGDVLAMILMRNISQRKKQERELKAFNNDIEEILRIKIDELKESEDLHKRLAREINVLKRRARALGTDDGMVGSSQKMLELREMIHQVADSDATILVVGESGTGKELVANMIRQHSSRREAPFLKVNCNSINENLLESDLFGYEKGAFTGAAARRKGRFEIVDGGTIFLDEIGDISPRMQSSLLRVLQNGELVRVGGTTPIKVDVRVIAATNVDLAKAVQDDKFRLDLYYRLNIIKIAIPALRERKEDIVELATHFVKHYRVAFKKEIDFLPSSIIDKLLEHDWPGNVRELENVLQRAVLTARNNVITDQDLVFDESPERSKQDDYFSKMTGKLTQGTLKKVLSEFESDMISHALSENKGNVLQAARMLDVGKTALYDKIKRYEISAKNIKPS